MNKSPTGRWGQGEVEAGAGLFTSEANASPVPCSSLLQAPPAFLTTPRWHLEVLRNGDEGTWRPYCEVGLPRSCPLTGLPEQDGPPPRMLGPGQAPSSQAKSHSRSCHLALCQKRVSQAAGKLGAGAAPPATSCPRGRGLMQGKHQIFREEVGSGSERGSKKTPPLGS